MDEDRPKESRASGLIDQKSLAKIKVNEVMNRRPRTVDPDTSIDGLIERMRAQVEGSFPVVDENRKLLGIVTESDVIFVLRAPVQRAIIGLTTIKDAVKYGAKTVGEIMTRRPITVTPEMTIQETLNLMAEHKLRHLPVVEGEKLVGLINLRDIIDLYHVLR